MLLKERGFKTHVDIKVAGGICQALPRTWRHRVPYDSINKGSNCASMTWRAMGLADIEILLATS